MKKKDYFIFLLVVLALAGIALLFFRLGDVGIFEPDEGRSADIAREMVTSGDFLIPKVNYVEHFHKPPFSYWAIAASLKIFGFNEMAVRFPSACAAFGLVLITFLIARHLFDRDTALVSSLVLLSSPLFLFMGRLATPDIFFVFLIAASLYGFVQVWGGTGSPVLWSAFGFFFLALAFLTKGPVGILIVFLPLLGWAYLGRDWQSFRKINWLFGLIVFLVVALPWFVYVCLKYHGLFHYFIFEQTAKRVLSTQEHVKNSFYPLFVLAVGFIPWSCLVPWGVYSGFSRSRKKEEGKRGDSLLVAWFLLPLAFFILIPAKQPAYILPVFPALAILVARVWTPALFGKSDGLGKFGRYSLWSLAFIFLAAAVGLFLYAMFFIRPALLAAKSYFLVLSVVSLCLSILTVVFMRGARFRHLFVAKFIVVILSALLILQALTVVGEYRSRGNLLKVLAGVKKDGEKVISFVDRSTALPFYSAGRVIEVGYGIPDLGERVRFGGDKAKDLFYEDRDAIFKFLEEPERVYILMKKSSLEYITSHSKMPLYTLAEDRKWVLVSNRSLREEPSLK